jgi:hypothetical protein
VETGILEMRKSTVILTIIAVVELIIIISMVRFVFKEDPELIKLREDYSQLKETTEFLNNQNNKMATELDRIVAEKEKAIGEKVKEISGITDKLRDSESKRAELKTRLGDSEGLSEALALVTESLELAENEIGEYKRILEVMGVPEITGFVWDVPQIEFPKGSITYTLYERGGAYREQAMFFRDNWLREVKLRELSEKLTDKTGKSRTFTLFNIDTDNILTFGLGILGGLGLSKIF